MLMVDSNIWAYYFDEDAPEHNRVADALDRALEREEIGVNTVVVMEVAHFLIKGLGPVIGKEKVGHFLSYPLKVSEVDLAVVSRAVELLARHSHAGIGGRDATILASAEALGTRRVMTHDEAFSSVDWVEVVDPLKRTWR